MKTYLTLLSRLDVSFKCIDVTANHRVKEFNLANVHKSLLVTRITNLEDKDEEVIWLLLKPQRTPKPFSVIIVSFYYSPGQTVENEKGMKVYLTKGLDTIKRFPFSSSFCCGKFQPNEA